MQRRLLIMVLLFYGVTQHAWAHCASETVCFETMQNLAQISTITPDIITSIQLQFDGRIISTQPSYDGNALIQILTQDNRVVIVTINPYGKIVSIQD